MDKTSWLYFCILLAWAIIFETLILPDDGFPTVMVFVWLALGLLLLIITFIGKDLANKLKHRHDRLKKRQVFFKNIDEEDLHQ